MFFPTALTGQHNDVIDQHWCWLVNCLSRPTTKVAVNVHHSIYQWWMDSRSQIKCLLRSASTQLWGLLL